MRAVLRGIVLTTLTSLLLAVAFMPAVAQEDPQSNPYGGENASQGEAQGPEQVNPGTSPTFVGDGFAPGAQVEIGVLGVVVTQGTVVANRGGVARATIEIPCGTEPGDATITMTGEGEDGETRVVETDFTVTDNTARACVQSAGLAATGWNFSNGLLVAAALLVVGGGAVYAGRRRNSGDVSVDA